MNLKFGNLEKSNLARPGGPCYGPPTMSTEKRMVPPELDAAVEAIFAYGRGDKDQEQDIADEPVGDGPPPERKKRRLRRSRRS